MISTGGTLASSRSDGGLSPRLHGNDILNWIAGLAEGCTVEEEELYMLDSSNMQPEEWEILAERIYRRREAFDGIVVIHGTDTLAYTASALSFALPGIEIPVVLTGSQVPIGTEIGYVVSFGQEPAPRAEEDGLRDVYVASINEEFDLSSVIGPGSDSTQIRISIQLTQMVNGRTVTKTLLPAHSVSGDTKLSIHFDNIVGEYGVEEGNVEVVNAVTGKVLETYHLTFAHEE